MTSKKVNPAAPDPDRFQGCAPKLLLLPFVILRVGLTAIGRGLTSIR